MRKNDLIRLKNLSAHQDYLFQANHSNYRPNKLSCPIIKTIKREIEINYALSLFMTDSNCLIERQRFLFYFSLSVTVYMVNRKECFGKNCVRNTSALHAVSVVDYHYQLVNNLCKF